MVKIIGVTGGIGSGKTTVSRILEGMGAYVIDADRIGREVVCRGEKAYDELLRRFGDGILGDDGEIDRKKLAAHVFTDMDQLAFLNAVTHKYIIERILEKLSWAKSQKDVKLVVLDVPLPIEHGFKDTADTIWVVACDRETRVQRIMERSGMSREEAIRRMDAQLSEEEYLKIADKVLYNTGDKSWLVEQVEALAVEFGNDIKT